MADLKIDSGPITADLRLRQVPQDQWFTLMQVRRSFLAVHLAYDCRRLLEFVEDAEAMAEPLGFANAEDFVRRGLELDPKQVNWALEGLRRLDSNEIKSKVKYARAIEIGKHGGNRKKDFQSNPITLKRGTSRPYILARLERDGYTDLLAQIHAKEITAKAAARKAGYIKTPTIFEQVAKQVQKLSKPEWKKLVTMETRRRAQK